MVIQQLRGYENLKKMIIVYEKLTFGCGFFGWLSFHEFYIIFSCEKQFGLFLPRSVCFTVVGAF